MNDLEFRLVDLERNRFRLYGLTEARTLFGEACLVIAWGRIGTTLRVRTETFEDDKSLERRRRELVARRRRKGYVEVDPGARPVVHAGKTRPRSRTKMHVGQIRLALE